MKFATNVKCPYCGHSFEVAIPIDGTDTLKMADNWWPNRGIVVTCDVEDCGCDGEFVVSLSRLIVNAEVSISKIEGEQARCDARMASFNEA